MGKINKLDTHITNLIAAGEVIERASSVVKELVENSIDAEATSIVINLTEAGLKEISVRDNGTGMDQYDARMCFEPHATSKIQTSDDLFKISTLGFRGEALPSIVAVSNVTLKTAVEDGKGIMFSLRGGLLVTEAMVPCPKGTEIIVKNLFYNTPARLQNLQSTSVELSYIVDYVQKEALAHTDIAFKLVNNDRVVFQTYGSGNLLEVISVIYGNDASKEMRDIFNNNGYFKIKGFISKLSISRSSKNHINTIVNGRIVKNQALVRAVLDGYSQYLVTGRYPICVINIEVDPALVDVNVHPAKLEVRFSSEDELLSMITETIAQALSQTNLIVDIKHQEEAIDEEYLIDEEENVDEEQNIDEDISEDPTEDITDENEDIEDVFEEELPQNDEVNIFNSFVESDDSDDIFPNIQRTQPPVNTVVNPPLIKKEEYIQQEYTFKKDEDLVASVLPKLTYIGQLFGTYLLCQDQENFYLIDQHAANERINYEKISKELCNDKIVSYELLVPIKVDFSSSEAILINEAMTKINALGIILDDFGGGTFTVREVPIWLFKGREKDFVEEIITKIITDHSSTKGQFLDNLAKSLACKKSIKANQYISQLEVEYMLDDLSKCKKPYTCPHGRPVIVKYNKYEIEKMFKRVV